MACTLSLFTLRNWCKNGTSTFEKTLKDYGKPKVNVENASGICLFTHVEISILWRLHRDLWIDGADNSSSCTRIYLHFKEFDTDPKKHFVLVSGYHPIRGLFKCIQSSTYYINMNKTLSWFILWSSDKPISY